MPWLWTDDLAQLLTEHDGIRPERLAEWRERPVGVAAAEGSDPLEVARQVLGVESEAVA